MSGPRFGSPNGANFGQVYKLPLLEILDLSRNKINALPDEINKLRSLRVLSIMQNRLDDLPTGLSEMNKLQILKIAGNPLRYPLRRVLEASEAEITSSGMTDNEKEVAVTAELKRFLRTRQQAATTPDPDSSEAYVRWLLLPISILRFNTEQSKQRYGRRCSQARSPETQT